MTQTTAPPPEFFVDDGKGALQCNMHSGQIKVWDSEARWVFALAGYQSGKTVIGPPWMDREIDRRGPGDYLVATSTYKLLTRKLLKVYRWYFEYKLKQATYNGDLQALVFHQAVKEKGQRIRFPGADTETQIFFGSAQSPESLESATVKAIHLDEVGQKQFKRDSWDAVERRGSVFEARILGTTTLYGLGWLKTQIYDPWLEGDPDIEVIQFPSSINPRFSAKEWERMVAKYPKWKADLFLYGRFSRPAGMIYDRFESERHIVAPHPIPDDWPKWTWHDFGPVNFVTLWCAQNPLNGELLIYREYKSDGKKDIFDHVSHIKAVSGKEGFGRCVGGAAVEDGWRGSFTQGGWPIHKPKPHRVEDGIQLSYDWWALDRIRVSKECPLFVDEILSYSRETDDDGEPTDKIDDDQSYHFMAAMRYGLGEFDVFSAGGPKRTSLPVSSQM